MAENNIPKSWVKCKFGEIATIQNGYAFATKDFRRDNGFPLIKQSQLNGDNVDLIKCILTKAFRGELVAQDENDEQASVLLKQIAAA